jgi:hypothetical protein
MCLMNTLERRVGHTPTFSDKMVSESGFAKSRRMIRIASITGDE